MLASSAEEERARTGSERDFWGSLEARMEEMDVAKASGSLRLDLVFFFVDVPIEASESEADGDGDGESLLGKARFSSAESLSEIVSSMRFVSSASSGSESLDARSMAGVWVASSAEEKDELS